MSTYFIWVENLGKFTFLMGLRLTSQDFFTVYGDLKTTKKIAD